MTSSQAESVVLGTAAVTGITVAYTNLRKTGRALPPAKSLVAFFVVFGGLSLGASAAPGIFGPVALLLGVAIVYSRLAPKGAHK